MKTYLLQPNTRTAIGRSGDTGITVQFDALSWYTDYPAGMPYLMVTWPGGRQTPVTVTYADGLISGEVPDELLVRPGLYSYVFAWVSAGEQMMSSPCGAVLLDGVSKRWEPHSAAPDWADRIFLAAETIEGKTDGAVEAAAAAQEAQEGAEAAQEAAEAAQAAAEDAQEAAEGAQAAAEAVQESIPEDYSELSSDVVDLKSALIDINYFSTHSATEGYTRVQDGEFSETSGYYDSNLIRCDLCKDFVIIIEKKSSSVSLPTTLVLNFFDETQEWKSGSANYTKTATTIDAADSVYGYGGVAWAFTVPNNAAYWSTYFSSSTWSSFGLFCYYATADGNRKFAGKTPVSALYYDEPISMGVIDGLDDAIRNIETDSSVSVVAQLLYGDWSNFDQGYLDGNGDPVQPYENAYFSGYIDVTPGSVVTYKLRIIGNSKMSGVAWYDKDKNFINSAKHVGDSGAQWYTDTDSVTLPGNAYYIRFSGKKGTGEEMSQYVTYYYPEKIKDYIEHGGNNGSQWQGKTWVAFGTSITDTSNTLGEGGTPTGKYVPYLQRMSGMCVINKGIAGGSIGVVSGVISGNIMTAIKSSSNLSDIQAADIITIEGFVNDFAGNLPIGTINDTDNSTLMGAIYEAVTYLYSQNEDATIVLLTETTGQNIDSSHTFPVTRQNSIDKYQYEYNDAIITMAKYLGCHVIDAGQKSQINQWHTEYLADWIHHSELGGKQYAETIWDELKNIHCNSDVAVE